MPQAPYSLPGHAMAAHLNKAEQCSGPTRFFRMRSTFYVLDFLAQRPMLSIKEPSTGTTIVAMDTIYSTIKESIDLLLCSIQYYSLVLVSLTSVPAAQANRQGKSILA